MLLSVCLFILHLVARILHDLVYVHLNLLCQQVSQLTTNLVFVGKLSCNDMSLIAFMDQDIVRLALTYFNGESQKFLSSLRSKRLHLLVIIFEISTLVVEFRKKWLRFLSTWT